MPTIRAYRPEDRAAVYDICVRTADLGGDARGKYPDDDLMGDLFAGPYLDDVAFVLDDGGEAKGYVVGTADTEAFTKRWLTDWLPYFAAKYPDPDQEMVTLGYHPERMILPELAAYPAHLHIDLLPGHQRRGFGRRLIETFLSSVDAPAVHLGMVTANVRARAFYDRVGFHVIPVPDPGPLTYLGRATKGA